VWVVTREDVEGEAKEQKIDDDCDVEVSSFYDR
jgi:hypothetical protein